MKRAGTIATMYVQPRHFEIFFDCIYILFYFILLMRARVTIIPKEYLVDYLVFTKYILNT